MDVFIAALKSCGADIEVKEETELDGHKGLALEISLHGYKFVAVVYTVGFPRPMGVPIATLD